MVTTRNNDGAPTAPAEPGEPQAEPTVPAQPLDSDQEAIISAQTAQIAALQQTNADLQQSLLNNPPAPMPGPTVRPALTGQQQQPPITFSPFANPYTPFYQFPGSFPAGAGTGAPPQGAAFSFPNPFPFHQGHSAQTGNTAAVNKTIEQVLKHATPYDGERESDVGEVLTADKFLEDLDDKINTISKLFAVQLQDEQKVSLAMTNMTGPARLFGKTLFTTHPEAQSDWTLFKARVTENFTNAMLTEESRFRATMGSALRAAAENADVGSIEQSHRAAVSKIQNISAAWTYFTFLMQLPTFVAANVRLNCSTYDIEKAYHVARNSFNNSPHARAPASYRSVSVANPQGPAAFSSQARANPVTQRVVTATEVKFNEKKFGIPPGGVYPARLGGDLKDDPNLRKFLAFNKICYYCRIEGHTSDVCPAKSGRQ